MQVTLRVCETLPDLRQPLAWAAIVRMLRALRAESHLRIVHYSVLANHLHLVCEADGAREFTAGMRSLCTRLALALNRTFARRGQVLDHRFHARPLTSPRAVAMSLRYVLLNARKHAAEHGQRMEAGWLDPRSSARAFDGWRHAPRILTADFGITPPRTWLLRVGWRRYGLLDADAVPGTPATGRRVAAGDAGPQPQGSEQRDETRVAA